MALSESPDSSEQGTLLSSPEQDTVQLHDSDTTPPRSNASVSNDEPIAKPDHVIKLSSIDHCMPRAYIRVCLAFRLPDPDRFLEAVVKLEQFVKGLVATTPFLAGFVAPAQCDDGSIGRVEIQFSQEDVRTFPAIRIRQYSPKEMPYTYEQLGELGLPPSVIRPDLVSSLPEGTDDDRAPVFRVQANLLEGGLIVSMYLHHCVTDGTGLGLLISSSLSQDAASPADDSDVGQQLLNFTDETLATIANNESSSRAQLSWAHGGHVLRRLAYKHAVPDKSLPKPPARKGRGCVFSISQAKLEELKATLLRQIAFQNNGLEPFLTIHDVLQALIWHHMTQARLPALLSSYKISWSKLLIPVNIRGRLSPPLAPSYFGSAVDFASAISSLSHLSSSDASAIATTALSIRRAVTSVTDHYVRSAITLSNTPGVDVRDLLASNMNRTHGADIYITSWFNLPLFEKGDLGMDLGMPDWVRKPWSRDPGACIILPQDPRRDVIEVVVQLAVADMERLLVDNVFMGFTNRVIE